MPISFTCSCGQGYTVPEAYIGRELRCPACQNMLVVPGSSGDDDDEPVADFDEVEEDSGPHYGLAGEAKPAAAPAVDDEPEVVDEAPEVVEDVKDDEDDDGKGDPEYFVAAYPPGTSLRQPKTFRFYRDRGGLMVLHAGPFGWNLVGILTDRPGVREKRPRDDGLGKGMESDSDEFIRKGLARRAAVLDRMTLDELRAEVASDKVSFRVTAENTPKVRIEPPGAIAAADDRRARESTVGRLKFTHATAGKWDLVLLTKADAQMAMRAFRRVLGDENVEVTLRVK